MSIWFITRASRGFGARVAGCIAYSGWTDLRKGFNDFFATPEGKIDPKEMIDRMIEIMPADSGKFRNVVSKVIEDMLKQNQLRAWENKI